MCTGKGTSNADSHVRGKAGILGAPSNAVWAGGFASGSRGFYRSLVQFLYSVEIK